MKKIVPLLILCFNVFNATAQKYKELEQDDFYIVGRDYYSAKDSTKLVGRFKFINYKPTPSGGLDLDGYVLCSFDELNRFHGVYREYNLRDKLRFEAEYVKGKKLGFYRTYDSEDKLLLDLIYHEDGTQSGSIRKRNDNGITTYSKQKGRLVGEYLSINRNGDLLKRCTYQNDTLVGPYIENFFDGKPKIRAEYLKGERLGEYIEYDYEGNKKEEANYRRRKNIDDDPSVPLYKQTLTYPVGELKRYRKGKLSYVEVYDNDGSLLKKESYYENGNIAMTSDYVWGETYNYDKNGKRSEFKSKSFRPNGTYKEFYDNGGVKKIENWENGKKNGLVSFYDPEGNITQSYTMSDNLMDGEYYEKKNGTEVKRIYSKGNIIHEMAFNDSKKIKEFSQKANGDYEDKRFWKSNGKLRSLQKYSAKDKTLESKGYDENGKQTSGGRIKDGKSIGRIWSMNSNGELEREEFYDDQGLPYGKHILLGTPLHIKEYSDNHKLIREVQMDSYNKTKISKELIYHESGSRTTILYYEGRREKVINVDESNTRHGDYIIYSRDKDKWELTIPYDKGTIVGPVKVIGRDEREIYTRKFPVDPNKEFTSFELIFNDTAPELILKNTKSETREVLYPFGRI